MRLNEITNNIMQDQNTHANGIFHIPKALNDVGLLPVAGSGLGTSCSARWSCSSSITIMSSRRRVASSQNAGVLAVIVNGDDVVLLMMSSQQLY